MFNVEPFIHMADTDISRIKSELDFISQIYDSLNKITIKPDQIFLECIRSGLKDMKYRLNNFILEYEREKKAIDKDAIMEIDITVIPYHLDMSRLDLRKLHTYDRQIFELSTQKFNPLLKLYLNQYNNSPEHAYVYKQRDSIVSMRNDCIRYAGNMLVAFNNYTVSSFMEEKQNKSNVRR